MSYQELKLVQEKILVAERILLQTLGFDLQIDHPYGFCMHLLKSHKGECFVIKHNSHRYQSIIELCSLYQLP